MVNNIGTTDLIFDTFLGATKDWVSPDNITLISGIIGKGCIIIDNKGTLAIITKYVDDNNFTSTVKAISINLQELLTDSY